MMLIEAHAQTFILRVRACYLYISTKGMGLHKVIFTENSTIKMVVRGRTNAYDKYGRYKPKRDIFTNILGKV